MELGGDYNISLTNLTVKSGNIFDYLSDCNNAVYFDSGRSALKHLVSRIGKESKVLLPEFICESVSNCFDEDQIDFYRINSDFTVDADDLEKKADESADVIFLMHYFGAVQPDEVIERIGNAAERNGCIIIEDVTHSIFSKKRTIGHYQICSLRKWMPIPSGGVLYSYNNDTSGVFGSIMYEKDTDNDRAYGMILKDLFLNDGFDCNPYYRKIFSECEKRLDDSKEIRLMSDFTRFAASCTDIDAMRNKRIENFRYLEKALGKIGILPAINLDDGNCPLVLPIRSENRDSLRSYLIDNRVYCAVHWPFDGLLEFERPFAKNCADRLISLPIDQRYGKDEMDYMISRIRDYKED